jgi:hypothetical protein
MIINKYSKNMKKIALFTILILVFVFGGSVNVFGADGWTTPDPHGLPETTVETILDSLLDWLLGIMLILGVGAFVVAGIMYVTALGDEGRLKTAKSIMTWAAIGVAVGLMAYVIITTINDLISGGSGGRRY